MLGELVMTSSHVNNTKPQQDARLSKELRRLERHKVWVLLHLSWINETLMTIMRLQTAHKSPIQSLGQTLVTVVLWVMKSDQFVQTTEMQNSSIRQCKQWRHCCMFTHSYLWCVWNFFVKIKVLLFRLQISQQQQHFYRTFKNNTSWPKLIKISIHTTASNTYG